MIRSIKKTIADRQIKRHLNEPRKVKSVNLRDALKVAVLVNVTEKNLYLEFRKLCNELETKNKEVKIDAVGWFKGKKQPEFVKANERLKLINTVDYNWFYRPKKNSTNLKSILEKEYDLLIDLTKNDIYPLRKICSMVKAGFKVGSFELENEPFYDLMVQYRSPKDYTAQVLHYLTLISEHEK